MPVFRELWGWSLFVGFAALSTVAVVCTTPPGNFWQVLITGGHKVEPLWIASAILAYTIREGANMLAERYLQRRFIEGKSEGRREERKAIMRVINANPGKTTEELRRLLEKEQGGNLTPNLPTDA